MKDQFNPIILIIKNKIENTNIFRFKHLMISDIKNEMKGLNPNKATTHNNISPKILRQSVQVTANTLQLLFNYAISNSEFPENLKLADVTPVFKKKVSLDKTHYRPVNDGSREVRKVHSSFLNFEQLLFAISIMH